MNKPRKFSPLCSQAEPEPSAGQDNFFLGKQKVPSRLNFRKIRPFSGKSSAKKDGLGTNKPLLTSFHTQKTGQGGNSYGYFSSKFSGIFTGKIVTALLLIIVGTCGFVATASIMRRINTSRLSVAKAADIAYVNGYPTINGNYIDCNGNIDNDSSHHVLNPADTDAAHHVGQNCPAGTLVGSGQAPAGNNNPPTPPAASQPPVGDSSAIVYVNGYPTLNGNYIDCNGAADNDPSHHTANPNDTDAGHRIGQNCQAGTMVARAAAGNSSGTQSNQNNQNNGDGGYGQAQPANNGNSPLKGIKFYIDPNSNAKRQADAWRGSRPQDADLMDKIASQPAAIWLGGWNGNIKDDVNNFMSQAAAQGASPLFVVYNIPNRDCGGYSAGGAQTADTYKQWISSLAEGIGSRRAVIVLEPDALALTTCLSAGELQARYGMLGFAVNKLKASGSAAVYLDAGHANWLSTDEIAGKLASAGIERADGFALNISNFTPTSDNVNYGQEISAKLGGKHFVVDTSRNGNGPAQDSQWCNPAGRALGLKPATETGNPLVDAFVWGKVPGESDGSCNGSPSAGVFWPDYALGLAQRAAW